MMKIVFTTSTIDKTTRERRRRPVPCHCHHMQERTHVLSSHTDFQSNNFLLKQVRTNNNV